MQRTNWWLPEGRQGTGGMGAVRLHNAHVPPPPERAVPGRGERRGQATSPNISSSYEPWQHF